MRRIRLAQTKAFEEECNLQFLKLTKDKVSKEVGKPSDTTRRSSHGSMGTLAENGVMNAKMVQVPQGVGISHRRNVQ